MANKLVNGDGVAKVVKPDPPTQLPEQEPLHAGVEEVCGDMLRENLAFSWGKMTWQELDAVAFPDPGLFRTGLGSVKALGFKAEPTIDEILTALPEVGHECFSPGVLWVLLPRIQHYSWHGTFWMPTTKVNGSGQRLVFCIDPSCGADGTARCTIGVAWMIARDRWSLASKLLLKFS